MRAPPCYILEGTWWSNREVPKVLPYFEALSGSNGRINLGHRTIRSADDIAYWVRKLPKSGRAFLYFASHGQRLSLCPVDERSPIKRDQLLAALREHKPGAIAFLHFGCCEMIAKKGRRKSLEELLDATGAQWVSGYTQSVDWFQSTFIDLALFTEVFADFFRTGNRRGPKLRAPADRFVQNYEQLARHLGFSGLSRRPNGKHTLFPKRLQG